MKKHHWYLILEPNMSAPKTGVYLFAIRNDNHISYECHKMDEGDSFYSAVGSSSTDPTDWFVPIAYHFCNEYVGFNELIKSSFVTESSWYPCHLDIKTDGLRVLAFTLNGFLTYGISERCVSSFERNESFTYIHTYLYPWWDDEMNNQQDIKNLAYHYVEFFGKKGHSYWWNEYREKQSNII